MQALVDALQDRTELVWRTDGRQRLWIRVRIGPERYWVSAQSPGAMQPLLALAASAAATFLLGVAAMAVLQRRLTRPLESLTAAVAGYSAGQPPPSVEERGPSELAALSKSFNVMTARLAANEAERALLLAGVSHDLRTPLAKLRLAVEMMARNDETLSRTANAQVAEIDRILGKFLDFARGFETEPEVSFDAEALIVEIAALHEAENIAFDIEASGPIPLRGRPEALRRALLNLTENAVRHGAPPFCIGTMRGPDRVDLYVRDGGGGLGPDATERIRNPFVRGSERTPGAGLGLAIAERVAKVHGGTLILQNLSPQGFEARLSLGLR
jgi:two-component system osmolarity sensor histidine kinase EnvZ